jgi:hypothetical protein
MKPAVHFLRSMSARFERRISIVQSHPTVHPHHLKPRRDGNTVILEEPSEEEATACEVLFRLPPAAGGIALNLMGMCGLLTVAAAAFPTVSAVLLIVRSSLLFDSALVQAVLLLRIVLNPLATLRELRSVRNISAYTALFVALQLSAAELPALLPRARAPLVVASVLVHASALANACLTLRFLATVYERRAAVEPYWFPAIVSLASLSLAGDAVGSPRPLQLGALLVGGACALVLLPWCMWRVLRQPTEVATNPSVVLLMAPAAFVRDHRRSSHRMCADALLTCTVGAHHITHMHGWCASRC